MPLGFIGTGEITSAIVTGLCGPGAAGAAPPAIIVSPRGRERARTLAERHASVTIAASNQEVLDRCDEVILAVRPQVAEAVLEPLAFRPEQRVVSVIAMLPLARLARLTAPCAQLARAAPPPPVALGRGATALHPDTEPARTLFARLGHVQPAATEDELELLFTATATMATYFAVQEALTLWLQRQGLPAGTAQRFTAELHGGLADVARAGDRRDPTRLREDFTTPGGINEQLYRALRDGGVFGQFDAALNAVLDRLRG